MPKIPGIVEGKEVSVAFRDTNVEPRDHEIKLFVLIRDGDDRQDIVKWTLASPVHWSKFIAPLATGDSMEDFPILDLKFLHTRLGGHALNVLAICSNRIAYEHYKWKEDH